MSQAFFSHKFYQLGAGLSVPINPQSISQPRLVKKNTALAEYIGLSPQVLNQQEFIAVFSGNTLPINTTPVAQAYAGHQFGNFNPFLGDGRSILLGEITVDQQSWDVVLKGAGKTPFTFVADGRATESECLHEYNLSERLSSLGVPATQALCVIVGGEKVYRKKFENIAVLTRIAPSFIRFGTFENCYFKKDNHALKVLADYVIQQHFPNYVIDNSNKNNYEGFFKEVVIRTAKLIAHWQSVGFVHGMMNTDNQSILGITLDLGESVLLDKPDDKFVASASDKKGRYAFGQQPLIGFWNCRVLAQALSPLIQPSALKQALSIYEQTYINHLEALKSHA